jgi:hypothetical protein
MIDDIDIDSMVSTTICIWCLGGSGQAQTRIIYLKSVGQQLWRKGVDAIIEEYKRKWTEREKRKQESELGITHHKKEDDKQQHAEVRQDAREDDDKRKDNKIPQSIMDACNHKLRMKKVTYHSGA